MAIAYKSQGAGVSTETSGAALSPLCPATVDAGDILIAHVFWEGTATAPSTPGTWTLLHGPELIQTTIARHWVFGKIADGTEDGAAVAFGNPAVTTQRAARVYSFSGRTDGTITQLVSGFAATSHATDPQMPTVTTTEAGNLAVALVAQNDNNAFTAPTGETGGDWVEAVAEYTVALTPGFSIGIETCTPTADPGTVTGGSMATTNDPCGVIGFQIRQSAADPQNVLPGVGAMTLTGFAPTSTTSDNKNVAAGLGALSLTGFVPTVTIESAGSSYNGTPGTGQITLSGFVPAVVTSDHQTVSPGVGAISLTGFSPSVQTPNERRPGVGQVTISGFAATVSVSDNINAEAATGSFTLNGFSPIVAIGVNILPGTGSLSVAGLSPAIAVSDNKNISPGVGELIFTGMAPSVTGVSSWTLDTSIGDLILQGFAPLLTITQNVNSSPTVEKKRANFPVLLTGYGIKLTEAERIEDIRKRILREDEELLQIIKIFLNGSNRLF